MDAGARRENQERWMADEVPVLVGTLAFGLGINKAAVRAVIHLALPKSIEQYYQEAGRAGRDGLPADCLLLWQLRDAALLAHFIKELSDPAETSRAWQRYRDIRNFAEGRICRHRRICTHFGESTKWQSCAACDICTGEPEWLAQAGDSERPRSAKRPSGRGGQSPVRPAAAAAGSAARPQTAKPSTVAASADAGASRAGAGRKSRAARISPAVAARGRHPPGRPGVHRHVRQHSRRGLPRFSALTARDPAHFRFWRTQDRDLRAAHTRCARTIPKRRTSQRRAAEAAQFRPQARFARGTVFGVSKIVGALRAGERRKLG